MKRYDHLSFKTRILVLFAFAAMLVSIIIYNNDNELLNFTQGFMGGMLIAFVLVEVVLFFRKRRETE